MTNPPGDALPVPVSAKPLSEAGTGVAQMRLALQVTSSWLLALVAVHPQIDAGLAVNIRHGGEIIARCSISEALDLANEALELGNTR